jgi:hypothetical protein
MSYQDLTSKAKALAQQLVTDGESLHEDEFSIENSNDKIVVVAIRVRQSTDVAAIKSFATKMATQPYGKPCSCCSGSGRA